jgi:hypothetical protein
MVYAVAAIGLWVYPGAIAIASSVSECETAIGVLYTAEPVVGVLPSVV